MNSSYAIMIGAVVVAVVILFSIRFIAQYRKAHAIVIERTLAIIKPDAIKAKHAGKIIERIEHEGFSIIDLKKVHLDAEQAERFYEMHKGKSFFKELVDFMCSGPIIVLILEKENGIENWRRLMGATDPAKAEMGTLRSEFGTNVGNNALHGSDSQEAATREIKFFFPQ
jgi:nucleoside-diphosphate kinase